MTETCTICRATVVCDRVASDEERISFLCEDCHLSKMYEDEMTDRFNRDELPKFKQLIEDYEHGLYTVEDFYNRMGELVEPF